MLPTLRLHKVLDVRATLVFNRLQRFYQTFNVIATLLGGLALAVMTFDEFHDAGGDQGLIAGSAGLLTSSAITAVVAVMTATMLLFKFEGHEKPTRLDLAVGWVPLVLVDLVIVEFLVGLALWYAAKYRPWCTALIVAQLVVMMAGTIVMAVWMWNSMSLKGGLGEEERKTVEGTQRVADE
ncbi:hypothetical protein GGR53DRAFT_513068 [Hypoxylon sp. FL1150]|nr:hypothetical protein GGR53DRAFT_513068 [Hypoxylon sp. FL1150]